MPLLDYKVVVQWSYKNQRYEAYSPTLMSYVKRFVPEFPKIAYGDSMSSALRNYSVQSAKLFKILKNLAILPPPPDVGEISLEEVDKLKKLGKMVL